MGSVAGPKLVDATAAFLRSDAFAKPVAAFVERECLVFEPRAAADGASYEHALVGVHAAYGSLVSGLVERFVLQLGASWEKLQAACLAGLRAPSTRAVHAALRPCSDFPAFFEMMAEANLALEAAALRLWHLQADFWPEEGAKGEDEAITREAALGAGLQPLPGSATLLGEYGLSEATVRELQAVRAGLLLAGGEPPEAAGAAGLHRRLGQLSVEPPSPWARAATHRGGGEAEEPRAPPVSPAPPGRRGPLRLRSVSLHALKPSASAPSALGRLRPPRTPPLPAPPPPLSIRAAGASAPPDTPEAAIGAAGGRRWGRGPAGGRELLVLPPPSSLLADGPAQQDGGPAGPAGGEGGGEGERARQRRPHRVPALSCAGPATDPSGRSSGAGRAAARRVARPGEPDWDESGTLELGASKWKVGKQIGRGASARVFVAVDMVSRSTIALKQLLCAQGSAGGAEAGALAELEREIAVMASLRHPHIVRYLGCERAGCELYIAMEYVRGGALSDLLKRRLATRERRAGIARGGAGEAEGAEAGVEAEDAGPLLPLSTVASYTAQILKGAAPHAACPSARTQAHALCMHDLSLLPSLPSSPSAISAPQAWPTCTGRAWCTATSSRQTSSWTRTCRRSRSQTSAPRAYAADKAPQHRRPPCLARSSLAALSVRPAPACFRRLPSLPLQLLEQAGGGGPGADVAQTLKGTPFWMSPEVIAGTGYGHATDVWSVGCVCVEMLSGRPPWSEALGSGAHAFAIMYHIVNAAAPPHLPPGLPQAMQEVRAREPMPAATRPRRQPLAARSASAAPDPLRALCAVALPPRLPVLQALCLMFERDPSKRPTPAELLDHGWLSQQPAPQPPAPLPLPLPLQPIGPAECRVEAEGAAQPLKAGSAVPALPAFPATVAPSR